VSRVGIEGLLLGLPCSAFHEHLGLRNLGLVGIKGLQRALKIFSSCNLKSSSVLFTLMFVNVCVSDLAFAPGSAFRRTCIGTISGTQLIKFFNSILEIHFLVKYLR